MNPVAYRLHEALASHPTVLSLHDPEGRTRQIVGWAGKAVPAYLPTFWPEHLERGWIAILWCGGLPETTYHA